MLLNEFKIYKYINDTIYWNVWDLLLLWNSNNFEKKTQNVLSFQVFSFKVTYACISHNCFYRSIHPRENKQNSSWVQKWTRVSYIAVY